MNGIIVKESLLNLEAEDKDSVIKALSKELSKEGVVENCEAFERAVITRENEITTGVGNGIAVPHGKSSSVRESTVIFARLNHSIDWGSIDDEPVDMVFLLAVSSKDQGDGHLEILASLAGRLMDEEFVESIRNTSNVDKIKEIIITK